MARPRRTRSSRSEELRRRFERALEALPPRTREAFALSRGEGQSYDQIALRMGISPKTVGVHISKALAALRRAFGIPRPDPPDRPTPASVVVCLWRLVLEHVFRLGIQSLRGSVDPFAVAFLCLGLLFLAEVPSEHTFNVRRPRFARPGVPDKLANARQPRGRY